MRPALLSRALCGILGLSGVGCWLAGCTSLLPASAPEAVSFERTRVFLAAADYRRGIDECQRQLVERPSAANYVLLTYVYQALDAYVESLAKTDRWVEVGLLASSLGTGRPEDLLDSPDVLARVAKELIQASARRQSDIAAAMAARLDAPLVDRLWKAQQKWRLQHSDSWWLGMPDEWEPSSRHLTPYIGVGYDTNLVPLPSVS